MNVPFAPTDGESAPHHPRWSVTAWRVYFRRGSESLFQAAPDACGRYPDALPAGIHRSGSWYVPLEQWTVAGRYTDPIEERRKLLIANPGSRVKQFLNR